MKKLNRMIYRWIEKNFMDGCSDYNPLSVRKRSRTKASARAAFDRLNVPHAAGTVFFSPLKALRFVRQHGFPVVIKPNVSGYSRGSHFPISTYGEFWKSVALVKIWWPSSIIESFLEGQNYRVVVIKDDIMAVIKRYPPFVVGDGKSSIEALIDTENRTRREMNLLPVMHEIKKNHRTRRYLKRRNLSLRSVPASGESVFLYNKVALEPGGVVETIDPRSVSPGNRELFLKILEAFDANIFGVDVIFEKGIEIDHSEQRCIFLELNSRPYLEMHKFPRFGARQNLKDYFMKLDSIQPADTGVF